MYAATLTLSIGMTLGCGVTQDFGLTSSPYSGLDRHGRVKDLHFKDGSSATLHRYQYGYDAAGNRTTMQVTQVGHDNERSYGYQYDALQRLVEAARGTLDNDNVIDPAAPYVLRERTVWNLDGLGNWAGGEASEKDSVVRYEGAQNETELERIHHAVNKANEIETLVKDWDAGANPPSGDETDFIHDPNGNLVWDGQYVHQYDAWNRLLQVNEIGSAEVANDPEGPDPVGSISSGELGDLIAHFTYDGLGRLARITRRGPDSVMHTVDCYYDGVRRIQEVIDDGTDAWTDREYVYGPDSVDEFILQAKPAESPEDDEVVYMLQDGNTNVVGLAAGPNIPDGQSGTLAQGTMLTEYTYDPYGKLVAADLLDGGTPFANRVGHQGLFFERLDGQPADAPLAENTAGLYYNRNRWYSPTLGRFVQRDPNDAVIPVITALSFNADAMMPGLSAFNLTGIYGDGMNLYQFAGSNPVNHRDPLGLEFWDDIDDVIADLTAQRIATLGYIQEASGWALIAMRTTLDIAGGILGLDLVNSVVNISNGEAGFWDYLEVGLAVAPIVGKLASVGLKVGSKAFSWGRKMFKGSRACNCFVAGTKIDTPEGSVRIEQLQVGDVVLTRSDAEPDAPPQPGRVTRIFRNIVPAILWLTLSNGTVLGTTPGHEVWTYEDGWLLAAGLEIGDTFAALDGDALAIVDIRLDPRPAVVYNFEVEGTFTYFVEGVWVHNKSCPLVLSLDRVHGGKLHTSFGQSRANRLKELGMKDVRWNQTLVNSRGEKISNLRPDIQYIDPRDGKVYIEEVIVTHQPAWGEDVARKLLGDDFGGYFPHDLHD